MNIQHQYFTQRGISVDESIAALRNISTGATQVFSDMNATLLDMKNVHLNASDAFVDVAVKSLKNRVAYHKWLLDEGMTSASSSDINTYNTLKTEISNAAAAKDYQTLKTKASQLRSLSRQLAYQTNDKAFASIYSEALKYEAAATVALNGDSETADGMLAKLPNPMWYEFGTGYLGTLHVGDVSSWYPPSISERNSFSEGEYIHSLWDNYGPSDGMCFTGQTLKISYYNPGGSEVFSRSATLSGCWYGWFWYGIFGYNPKYAGQPNGVYTVLSTIDGAYWPSANQRKVGYGVGSLWGEIINPDEAGVPFATVIIKNAVTGVEVARTTTDANGNYNFPDLPKGSYLICYVSATYLGTCRFAGVVKQGESVEAKKGVVVEDVENVAGAQKQTETNFAREYYGYLIDFGNILSFNNVPKSLMEGSGLPAGPATRLTGDILGSSAEYLRGKELISGALYGDMIKVARPLAQAGKYGTLVGDVFIGAGIGLGIAGGENPDTIMERTGGFYKFFYDLYGKYLPDQKGWLLQLKDSLDKMVTDTMKEFRMEIAIV